MRGNTISGKLAIHSLTVGILPCMPLERSHLQCIALVQLSPSSPEHLMLCAHSDLLSMTATQFAGSTLRTFYGANQMSDNA